MIVKKPTEDPHEHRLIWSKRIGINVMNALSFQEGDLTFYGLGHLCQKPADASQVHREGKDTLAIRKSSLKI